MSVCCEGVMYAEMGDGDRVASASSMGKGATLKIRYRLPKNSCGSHLSRPSVRLFANKSVAACPGEQGWISHIE